MPFYVESPARVTVWGKPHTITVYQKSKTVWIAFGEYNGERIEAKGTSKFVAASHWKEAARVKGNQPAL